MHGRAADVAEQVAGRVHRLQLPVALDQTPDDVRTFAEAGYATVICLPLRDSLAASRAQDELRLLSDEEAPITLFPHRLSALTIEKIALDGAQRDLDELWAQLPQEDLEVLSD